MRLLLLCGLAVSACRFSSPGEPADASVDAPPDAPLVDPAVKFTAATVSAAAIRPGLYGVEVTTTLRNDRATPITGLRASLTFRDAAADRAAEFRWRDADARDGVTAPQPASVGPGQEVTFRFRVDVLPGAVISGPILVGGTAAFQDDGAARQAAALEPPASVPFEAGLPPAIVVGTTADEEDGDAPLSLREAITAARQNAGFDRIVFDPAVFPPGVERIITLDDALDELPQITSGVTVIDGGAARVVVAVNPTAWAAPSGRYGLRVAGGMLVVHGLELRDFAAGYRQESLATDNCGSGTRYGGGAILVTDGTLIFDGNTIADPDVAERNCYAASVRLQGGVDHRVLDNRWTQQVMDALYIAAPTREVSDNVMDAGTTPAERDRSDDCIYVELEDDSDLWIVGNTCVDQEFSAIAASGNGTGVLHVVNNTFARNGRVGRSAVLRENGHRPIELRNNAYHANAPAAIQTADGNGVGITTSHETAFPLLYCSGCSGATIDLPTIVSGPTAIGLADPAGASRAALAPAPGSPLINAGVDLVDRNGAAPGRYNGAGPERGAVELP